MILHHWKAWIRNTTPAAQSLLLPLVISPLALKMGKDCLQSKAPAQPCADSCVHPIAPSSLRAVTVTSAVSLHQPKDQICQLQSRAVVI